MSRIKFKFIDALSNLVFQDEKVQNGDKIEEAIGKLQGQIDSIGPSFVPTLVLSTEAFEVPENTQALFIKRIKIEDGGRIKLSGLLIET